MNSFDLEALKAQAVSLGLSFVDIGKFALQQQAIERDERAAEREAAAEHEAAAAAVAEHEEKLQLARLEANKEITLARIAAQASSSRSALEDSVGKPRFPQYQDGEDIASHLVRFERVAELLYVDEESYAVRLGSLLTGVAAEIYTLLDPGITKNLFSPEKSSINRVS